MLKAFKYRIYPNKDQIQAIDQAISLCQKLYNSALEHRIYLYKHRKISVNYYDQANELPNIKKELPEYKTIHSQVLQDVLKRLDKTYQNFFRRVKQGETAGFPRFQSHKRYNSFTYAQSGFGLSGNHLKLSKVGSVKVKLHRPIEGVMKTCTVIRKNGKYYICLACKVEAQSIPLTHQDVGIDMGVTEFCTTSDGEFKPNPKHYRKTEAKLKSQQQSVSRKKKGSYRRKKAVAILSNTHEHICNQRKDNAFKVAHDLLGKYDTICREDLQIKNMVKNHKLAKSISDAGWGIFFAILEAKAKQTLGKRVIAVDPQYTSQTCSSCGNVDKNNRKTQSHFECTACGFVANADINASINILNRGLAMAC